METVESEPGWRPDPTGRHELRFWTGVRWADHVCDAGAVSHDSSMTDPPVTAFARAPGWYPDPLGIRETRYFDGDQWAETAVTESASVAKPSRRRLVIAIVVLAAFVVGGGAVFLRGGGGGDGSAQREIAPLLAGFDILDAWNRALGSGKTYGSINTEWSDVSARYQQAVRDFDIDAVSKSNRKDAASLEVSLSVAALAFEFLHDSVNSYLTATSESSRSLRKSAISDSFDQADETMDLVAEMRAKAMKPGDQSDATTTTRAT